MKIKLSKLIKLGACKSTTGRHIDVCIDEYEAKYIVIDLSKVVRVSEEKVDKEIEYYTEKAFEVWKEGKNWSSLLVILYDLGYSIAKAISEGDVLEVNQ